MGQLVKSHAYQLTENPYNFKREQTSFQLLQTSNKFWVNWMTKREMLHTGLLFQLLPQNSQGNTFIMQSFNLV